jgi:cation diffusion facilitator family transporter
MHEPNKPRISKNMSKNASAVTAVVGGFIIFGLKLLAYFLSGSVALLSDALESIANIAASFIMFVSVRISNKPPDDVHQYGHQKVENISAFIEGALILVAGSAIIYTAVNRLFNPVELGTLDIALGVSLLATASNYVLSMYLAKNAKKLDSMALEGDSKHLLSDVFSSIGVVIGLVIAKFTGWTIMDPLLAFLVGFLVLKMGIELILKAGNGLIDQNCPEEEARIRAVLDSHNPSFVDYHNLKTRRNGDKIYAELHLSIDGSETVQEAHDFTDHLQEDIQKELPEIRISIHVEPPKSKTHD